MRAMLINRIALAAVILVAAIGVHAQTAESIFKVMTLNVDGLPAKIFFFNVNADGPKSAGSELISNYIARQDCDIVAMQENFNYRWEIWSQMIAGYDRDEWTGGILLDDDPAPDYTHLQNFRFGCDGLNTAWKKQCRRAAYERVAWRQSFGKFSHDFDDIITKGFRRHDMTLADGTQLVVYNMHMDSSTERDELVGNDIHDREARMSQWAQLREYIMEHLDSRPVIIAGDMNSLYHRDEVKKEFIDAINQTGRATVADAWVELQCGGVYAEQGTDIGEDSHFDKILYVNPTNAAVVIKAQRAVIDDKEYVDANGKDLGDHYPLIVTFSVASRQLTAIGEAACTATEPSSRVYSLKGTIATDTSKGVIIENRRKRLSK